MNKNDKKIAMKKMLKTLKSKVFSNQKGKISKRIKYKFEIVEDTEGTTLHYPDLEVGAPVFVGDAEGGEIAQDGHYQIDESISIFVEDGVIVEITNAEEVVSEEMESDENIEVAEEVVEILETVVDLQETIEDLKEDLEEVAGIAEEFKKMKANVKSLTSAFQKFSKEPMTQSVRNENFNSVNPSMSKIAGILGKKK